VIAPITVPPDERRAALWRARLHPLERRRALVAIRAAASGPLPHERVLLWRDRAMLDPAGSAAWRNFWVGRDETGQWSAIEMIS
jgi:hypothetical protein